MDWSLKINGSIDILIRKILTGIDNEFHEFLMPINRKHDVSRWNGKYKYLCKDKNLMKYILKLFIIVSHTQKQKVRYLLW